MRLATITNWAYGATVALTLASATTMLLASAAQEEERAAVAQRFRIDRASERLDEHVYALTDRARQYLMTRNPAHAAQYRREAAQLGRDEDRIRQLAEAGATRRELALLSEGLQRADALRDTQRQALSALARGEEEAARQLLFGSGYEDRLNRIDTTIRRFEALIDARTAADIAHATNLSRAWRTVSEIVLGLTGALFLCVLFFVFTRRVLRPVVRLSDVVNRLAAQDFAVDPPEYGEIDEIGDMAQAIRVFRENGLERQRLETERNADAATRELLSRMTQRMQGCDTLADLQNVVRRFVPEIAPALAGRLYFVDHDRNAVVAACSWQDPARSAGEFAPIGCWALRRGVPHRPAGGAIDVPCDHLERSEGPLPDTLCLPLTAHGKTLGLLYFEPREPDAETGAGVAAAPSAQASEPYLHMLAENVSLALANLRLRETLSDMAMLDPLTGLPNRRQLDAMQRRLAAQAGQSGAPVTCLMVDIDHFKQVNDRFGHDAGDDVLREVAGVLRQATRKDGEAFRYGGEEFLVLLPGLGAGDAMARAEALRARIAGLQIEVRGQKLGPVTVSVGIATAPDHCAIEALAHAADAALYKAKAAGRNRSMQATARKDQSAA